MLVLPWCCWIDISSSMMMCETICTGCVLNCYMLVYSAALAGRVSPLDDVRFRLGASGCLWAGADTPGVEIFNHAALVNPGISCGAPSGNTAKGMPLGPTMIAKGDSSPSGPFRNALP